MQASNKSKLRRLKKRDAKFSRMSPLQHELNIYKAALHAIAESNGGEFSIVIKAPGGSIATKVGKDVEGKPVIHVKSMSSSTKIIDTVSNSIDTATVSV